MTKNEIIVKLDELGLEFDATDKKGDLEALLKASEANTPEVEETQADEPEMDEEVTLTDNEVLFMAIDTVIGVANKIMAKDRSRVLRLKNLVGKLEDAKRIIK